MKKIFTLLTLMVLSVSAWAGDVYKITFNGANAEFKDGESVSAGTFFSWNSAKHSFNSKFTGATWDGTSFTSGLKMEGATNVSFKSTAEATVTIVQSTWLSNNEQKTIKFDGTELDVTAATAGTECLIYTITKVAPGDHSVTRGNGESGVFAIKVEYTGEAKTTLATPEITFNATTGEVTIGAVENATEIRYTTDDSDPTAENGEVYSAPFTATDGTVVKAIAIGTGSYVNSEIASKQVLIEGTVPVKPVIKSQAGAVAITCETAAVDIEYSTNGTDYVAYVNPFFQATDATISARAKRGDKTSEVAQFEFKAVAQPNNVETVVLVIPDDTNANSFEVEGCTVAITGNAGKNYTNATAISVNGTDCVTAKLSNGAQNTITLPTGKKAVRLTLYSYINAAATGARTCGWAEVNGVSYDVKEAPMSAFSSVTDFAANPDIRSYLIDGKNAVTFTNTGEQLCFVAVVDIATDSTIIPTAISEVKAAEAAEAAIYNLAGQKVDAAFKGIVIKNGKKYLNK